MLKPVPLTVDDALNVVNAPVLAVVEPMAGGLDRSNVPPSVTVPLDVMGPPVSVIPLTVPDVFTKVTPGLFTAILAPPS